MSGDCEPISVGKLTDGMKKKEISVRVIRKWIRKSQRKKGELNFKEELYGLEFILLDAEETQIQASANLRLLDTFDKKLKEGETYKISKFSTSKNASLEMATLHNSRIYLEYSTRITKADLAIPMNSFRFASIADIIHNNVKNNHYIDVVGEIIEYRPITNKDEFKWTSIDIIDDRNDKITCRVWGSYCDDITNILTQSKQSSDIPILVIQFTQRNEYGGATTITTTRGATRFFLNPNIAEVKKMRERRRAISGEASSRLVESTNDKDILQGANLKKLIDIKNIDKAGDFVTFFTVVELDTKVDWYYNSCNHCRSKARFVDGLWICEGKRDNCLGKEGMTESIPRYQAKFNVADVDVEADIKVFDTTIAEVFNISAVDLIAKQEKAGNKNKIPTQFRLFIDIDFIAKLRVSHEFNLEKNSHCYTVLKMTDDEQVIERWKKDYSTFIKGKQVVDDSELDKEQVSAVELEILGKQVEDNSELHTEQVSALDLELLENLQNTDDDPPTSTTSSCKTPQSSLKRTHPDNLISTPAILEIKDKSSTTKLIKNIKQEKTK